MSPEILHISVNIHPIDKKCLCYGYHSWLFLVVVTLPLQFFMIKTIGGRLIYTNSFIIYYKNVIFIPPPFILLITLIVGHQPTLNINKILCLYFSMFLTCFINLTKFIWIFENNYALIENSQNYSFYYTCGRGHLFIKKKKKL